MSKHLPSLQEIDRLLIVKTSSIGDVVHALPIVESLKKARPSLTIGWVVRRRCANILTGNPNIDRVHVVDDKPDFNDLIRLRRELRGCQYQCALDMQGLFLSGLYAWLSGAPVRIGIDRNREQNKLFLTHPLVAGKPCRNGAPDRHAVDILYGFAEILGVRESHEDFSPQAYLAAGSSDDAVQSVAVLPRPRIALNVGASSPYKQWPIAHWIVLADQLIAAGWSMVFVGDKRDEAMVGDIIRDLGTPELGRRGHPDKDPLGLMGKCLDLSGKTDLRQLAGVLDACDVVLTGDTGPMHIAVAVNTPVVALFGSTNADRTGPYGNRNTVLNMALPCSPCYRNPTCDGRVDCMRAITPDAVFRAVKEKILPVKLA